MCGSVCVCRYVCVGMCDDKTSLSLSVGMCVADDKTSLSLTFGEPLLVTSL